MTSSYDRKRDFGATPEPAGDQPLVDVDPLIAPVGETFVIQQHHATALHHDVRLEMLNGETPVLVSWAVPKGLPRQRGQRHLAIRTEDHPMEYATFTGSIPEGEYGGGDVRIFDHGTWELVGRTDDRLTFQLEGGRLQGIWHLVHTGVKDRRDQWLAMMREDQRPVGDHMPAPEPMLAAPAEEAFDDLAWGFEPRWSGTRAFAICGEGTQLVSADGKEVSDQYPELAGINRHVVAMEAMLDGVIVTPVAFIAFDLLYLDRADLRNRPLEERRRLLEEAVVPSERLVVSPGTPGEGVALFEAAGQQGLSGIVAKRLSSSYQPFRSSDWLEIRVA